LSDLLEVKGIGKALETKLAHEGIRSVKDLVETLPAKYEKKRIFSWDEVALQKDVTLSGTVAADATVFFIRRRLSKLTFSIKVEHVAFSVVIFNREFMKNTLLKGAEVVITGKFLHNFHNFVASEIVTKSRFQEGIVPIYNIEGLSSRQFHRLVLSALPGYIGQIEENLPDGLLQRHNLIGRKALFRVVHRPKDDNDVQLASKRIKYEEFLLFALRLAALKRFSDRIVKEPKHYDIERVRAFIGSLPFELTKDQKQATNEIFRDFLGKKPMNRLLQGDVGSGKTICAMIAALAVCSAGEQTAYMAPTEILAYQHYLTFSRMLASENVKIAFLSSGIIGSAREAIYADLASGRIQIIIGTHALIQEELVFHKLGFVVIDEQHRFGVTQRKIIREKGITPDVLFMSATPIPRTLAITMFADMDISSIKTIPSGRKSILSRVIGYEDMDKVYSRTASELEQGHQAYFIVPLIDENANSSLLSVKEFYQEISGNLDKKHHVGLLHGRLKAAEKAAQLEAFYANRTQVLVSTTVVEVGLDVPNATIITIMNATRFGLSQLHQLRGRVGRDRDQAYCFFVTDDTLEGFDKLEILEKTTDGFEISEADLRMRGPGEVFGEEQTGLPRFAMANIILDQDILVAAIGDSANVLASAEPVCRKLVAEVNRKIDAYNLD